MSATEPTPIHLDEHRIKAIAVSRGIGVGPAIFLPAFYAPAEHLELADIAVVKELERLQYGVDRVREHLDLLTNAGSATANGSISGIFDTHLLILESFTEKVKDRIRKKGINAEWAISSVLNEAIERQGEEISPHLSEKQIDLKDVAAGILDELRNSDRIEVPKGSVVIAREIRPSSVMDIARTEPAAIVSRRGGWTSHSSILARELGIPMVTGADLSSIHKGDMIIANGYTGEIIVRPEVGTLSSVQSVTEQERLSAYADQQKTTTASEKSEIKIRVNAESSTAYESARAAGAVGIGLFRSESLVANFGKMPTEIQQVEAYTEIAATVGEDGVNIRTFDIGPEAVDIIAGVERNPSLGLRSIRLCLAHPEILAVQVKAILRSNEHGNISIVVPMVSGLAEISRFRAILDDVADSMIADGWSPRIPKVGAMIEIPSAVFMARDIASTVDFMCLGTNDLVQYLLAVDRDNDAVAEWYQTLHPAVLRAIREVVAAGLEAGITVTACGEMAGSPFYIPLLVGLGIREFSMSGTSIAAARRLINGISIADAEAIAAEALNGKTASEIDAELRQVYARQWPGFFPHGFLDLKY